MHQDRNNENWPELKRKKQRLFSDEDLHIKPRSHFENLANKTEKRQISKKIKANDEMFDKNASSYDLTKNDLVNDDLTGNVHNDGIA